MPASPILARLLLRILLPVRDREFIIGDLDEEYDQRRASVAGRFSVWVWYWRQALASIVSEARYEAGAAPVVAAGEPKRGSMIDTLRQDLRYAWRSLNQRPAFTAVAVITLALGIGANTGIFSIANWLLLRPVPGVARPSRLAVVEFSEPTRPVGISWLNYIDLQKALPSFAGLAGSAFTELHVLTEGAPARLIRADAVGGDYFGVLGVEVKLGRPILPQETAPGQHAPVAVISERLWTELFKRDERVVGRRLRANKTELRVVGVAARFQGIDRAGEIDVWVPYSMYARLRHTDEQGFYQRGTGIRMFSTIGRLKPGVTTEAAQADVRRAITALIQQYPGDNEVYKDRNSHVYAGIGVRPLLRERTTQVVDLMLLVVGFLLIISSANVANMLLIRGAQKRPEAAVRRALGASSGRIARQLVTESLLLALLGGLAGLVVAGAFLKLVAGGRVLGLPPIENVPMDSRVFGFTLVLSIVTGLLFGLAPLNVIRRLDLNAELHGSSSRHTRDRTGLRNTVVVMQVSLSIMLVIGALLLGRTLNALLDVELGFDPEQLAGIQLNVSPQAYTTAQVPLLGSRLLELVRASDAVESAALSYALPFAGSRTYYRVADPLERSSRPKSIEVQHVSDDYFRTLRIRILRGRALERRDWLGANSTEVNVVLSTTAAAQLFGARDPLGSTLTAESFPGSVRLQVVGIADDARTARLNESFPPLVYWPFQTLDRPFFSVVVRARSEPARLEPELQRALGAVDPSIPLTFKVVADDIRVHTSEQRLLATLFFLFAGLGVLLAAIGLYGVLGATVNERRREFGIRLALGADTRRILSMVVDQSARIVVLGLVLGIMGAVWLSRFLQAQLYGVSRFSGGIYLAAAVIFGVAALIATAIPTRAATRVEPTIALRQE